MNFDAELILEIRDRLTAVQSDIKLLTEQHITKERYSTSEVATRLGKAEFTVREWCRLGRILAQKRQSGRGKFQAWVVSHAELLRFERDGLLPLDTQ